jgi:hypothetical protein
LGGGGRKILSDLKASQGYTVEFKARLNYIMRYSLKKKNCHQNNTKAKGWGCGSVVEHLPSIVKTEQNYFEIHCKIIYYST